MTVLEEILAKGEVEPELLNELTDEQKIVLFYKIRQEQIKRWDLSYRDVTDEISDQPKINFLKGKDGNEWVWVMGDAPEDESYDQIWVKYALQNAKLEVAKEISSTSPDKSEDPVTSGAIPGQQIEATHDWVDSTFFAKEEGEKDVMNESKEEEEQSSTVLEPNQNSNSYSSGININVPKYNGSSSNHEATIEPAVSVISASPEEMRALSEEEIFYSDDDAEETKFPVSEPVPEKKVSESSDDSMPFPVAGTSIQSTEQTSKPVGYTEELIDSSGNSGNVISENVGTLQDRIRMFNQSIVSDRSYNTSPSVGRLSPEITSGMTNLQIFKPVLPNSGPSARYNDPRFGPFSQPKIGAIEPYRNEFPTRMSAEIQPSLRTNMSTGSHIHPPTFKPTYSASVTKPYSLQNENFAGGTWQLQSNASPSPHFNSNNMPQNFFPYPQTEQRAAPRSTRMGDSNGLSGLPQNSSMTRTGGPPQQIKTNPLAKPPSAASPSSYKPTVPPRNFNNRTPVSEFSSNDDNLPMAPINLDASVSQLIAKQNAMVRKFLRKSLINDEMEANTLQADWEERERKAKEKEEELKRSTERFREIARRVIQEQLPVPLSRAFLLAKSSNSSDASGASPQIPQTKADVIQWFQREELPSKASCDPETGAICVWFHGIIDRDYAERLLSQATVGSFLIRVSQKIYGYTLSYRTNSRCKHFLIDKNDNSYQFFGLNMKRHSCLFDLVTYHRTKPVSAIGNELLINPIGQLEGYPLDYAELFQRNVYPASLVTGAAGGGGNSFPQTDVNYPPSYRNLSLATQF